jgi:hypothetical protein
LGNRGGLLNFDTSNHSYNIYSHDQFLPSTLSHDKVLSIYYDKEFDLLWVGTENGVNMADFNRKQFKLYRKIPGEPNSLAANKVKGIYKDKNNNLWVGADGLNKIERNGEQITYSHFQFDPSRDQVLVNNDIWGIAGHPNGYVYGIAIGITRVNPVTNELKGYTPLNSGMETWFNWIIYRARDNFFYLGGDQPLSVFYPNEERFVHYENDPNDPGSINGRPFAIFEDSDGNVWLGTSGLEKFDPETGKTVDYMHDPSDPGSISNDAVLSINESADGKFLWVGTRGGGLNKFDKEKEIFTYYTEHDGLPSNVIYSILKDKHENLWMSTTNGISKFNPDTEYFNNYDEADGLQGNNFQLMSFHKAWDGEMFFGGPNGLSAFYPDSIKPNPTRSKPMITGLSILNNPVEVGQEIYKDVILDKPIYLKERLRLKHKIKSFSLEFNAMHYAAPEKNQYKYILEGFDESWARTGANKRYASYSNLPGGDYVFKVLASNNDGIWTEEPAVLEIEIIPPLWRKTWFLVILGLFLGGLVTLGIRLRILALRKEQRMLQEKVDQAVSEVESKKQEIEERNKELQGKHLEDEKRNWASVGYSKFGDLLRQNNDNINKMAYAVLSELIKYMDVDAGAFFVKDEDENGETGYKLEAAMAYSEKKEEQKFVHEREDLIGASAFDKKTMYLTDVPEGYLKIASGMGESQPASLLVVPLVHDEEVFGVIEVASLHEMEQYKIDFLEELSEKIASTINNVRVNEKNNELLTQSKQQAEQLMASEEELRQNMEEMQATQEEAARREKKLQEENDLLKRKLKELGGDEKKE